MLRYLMYFLVPFIMPFLTSLAWVVVKEIVKRRFNDQKTPYKIIDPQQLKWRFWGKRGLILFIMGCLLGIASLIFLALFSGESTNMQYYPPVLKPNGVIQPGHYGS